MSLYTTQEKVIHWATTRNIIGGSKPQEQFNKLIEEVGELANGIAKNKLDVIKDSVGDALVVLTNILAMTGTKFNLDNLSEGVSDVEFELEPGFTSKSKSPHIQMLQVQANLGSMATILSDYVTHSFNCDGIDEFVELADYIYPEESVAFVENLKAISSIYGFTIEEAFDSAYNEIKDRKGMLKDGSFVKYEDLSKEEQALLD